MREIKFRAWDKNNQEMLSWETLCANHFELIDLELADDANIIFLEYTGLKDKNGTEICCSDIWKGPMCFGPIGMLDKIVAIHNNVLDFGKYFGYADWDKGEVIGNIYENPGLIKE